MYDTRGIKKKCSVHLVKYNKRYMCTATIKIEIGILARIYKVRLATTAGGIYSCT
jgi:hypothetical protein